MNITLDSTKPEYIPSEWQPADAWRRMGPRLRHEARILLPYAIAMIVCEALTLSGTLIMDLQTKHNALDYLAIICLATGFTLWPVSLCALCLQSFLTEFHNSTISQLIVQPISRRQIWLEKTGITAAMLLPPVGIGYVMFVVYELFAGTRDTDIAEMLFMLGVSMLAFICNVLFMAPFIATVTRRSLAALLLLLGYTLGCWALLALLASLLQPDGPSALIAFWIASTALLIILAITGYTISYHRFLWMEV